MGTKYYFRKGGQAFFLLILKGVEHEIIYKEMEDSSSVCSNA